MLILSRDIRVGVTCATDVAPTFPSGLANVLNASAFFAQCESALSEVTPLPGSNRFVGPLPVGGVVDVVDEIRTLVTINSYAPDALRPYLQFWAHARQFNPLNKIIVAAKYSTPGGSTANIELVRLESGAVPSNTSCPASNDWFQVSVSIEPLLQLIASGNLDITKNVNFEIVGEQLIYFDNVEFVGPPILNDTYEDRFIQLNKTSIVLSFETFGQDLLAASLYILPLLYLLLALVFITPCLKQQRTAASILSVSWLIVSTAVVGYAIVEYGNFLEETAKLDSDAAVQINEYLQARANLNPREFGIKIEGGIPFGFTSVAIPRFNQSALETVFKFSEDPVPEDIQDLICPSSGTVQCLTSPEEFFNTTEEQGSDIGILKVESQTVLTQDYFLPILLGSLIADVVITGFQVLLHVLTWLDSKLSHEQRPKRFYKVTLGLNVLSIVAGLVFSAVIVAYVIIEPIRYASIIALKEQGSGSALLVEPRNELLTVLGNGDFFLDSSVLGQQTRCPVVGSIESVGLEPQTLAQAEQFDEVFPTVRIGTVDQTCDADSLSQDFIAGCYSLDCSNGRIPLVSSKSVQERIEFLYDRVIYNLVVVDVVVTLVDVLVFVVYLRSVRRNEHSFEVAINKRNYSKEDML